MSNTPAFDDRFVTAVNTRGEKQTIPAHWLDHPVLGRGFRRPASATPSMSWNRQQLDAHATGLGIDVAAMSTKAEVLDAINQTPSLNPSEDETPSAGA